MAEQGIPVRSPACCNQLCAKARGLLCDGETFQHGANLPPRWNRAVLAKYPPWLCPRVGSSKMQHSAHRWFSLYLFQEAATPKSQPAEGKELLGELVGRSHHA